MNTQRTSKVYIAVAILVCVISCWSLNVLGAESRGEAAVQKELEKDIGMPTLDGDLWQKMTNDDKIAFVWGFWSVVSIEYYIMDKYPDFQKGELLGESHRGLAQGTENRQ